MFLLLSSWRPYEEIALSLGIFEEVSKQVNWYMNPGSSVWATPEGVQSWFWGSIWICKWRNWSGLPRTHGKGLSQLPSSLIVIIPMIQRLGNLFQEFWLWLEIHQLVGWASDKAGAVATSAYSAEFCAMLTSEEAITISYVLCSLGIPVNEPTKLFGDNLGAIQNASIPEAYRRLKHTAISFHRVRECLAAKIVEQHKIDGRDNFTDIFI